VNVVKQAEKAGVKKVVLTSSIVTVLGNPNGTFTDKGMHSLGFITERYLNLRADWHPVENGEAFRPGNPFGSYMAAKTLAEQELWKLSEQFGLDVTTSAFNFTY
jgi:nucleoside-diphosphate-sugar epimerase